VRTETILKSEGMHILLEKLGKVDAERFISLIIREPFDYTKWQENILNEFSVRELSAKAMKIRE